MIDDHDLIAIQAIHLMRQKVRSLLVSVISDYETFSFFNELEKLSCFGTGSRAHI